MSHYVVEELNLGIETKGLTRLGGRWRYLKRYTNFPAQKLSGNQKGKSAATFQIVALVSILR
jgi:hypothetical protein